MKLVGYLSLEGVMMEHKEHIESLLNPENQLSLREQAAALEIRNLRSKLKGREARVAVDKERFFEITWHRGNDNSINRPATRVLVDRPDAVLELIYILAQISELHEKQTELIPGDKIKIFSNQQYPKLADSVVVTREVWRDANNSG